jgi:hypothetical protein
LQRVAQVLFFDFVLVVLFVHEDVQRIGEVRVGHRLLVQHDDVELVVAAEHVFQRSVGQKILHLPLVGEARAARAVDVGAQHDERLGIDHDDVADTDFFCGFHRSFNQKRSCSNRA